MLDLAGRLNLALDLRANLKTGTDAGSACDAAYPGEKFQFAIERTERLRVRGEQRFVIRVGDAICTGGPLMVIAIIAILIGLQLPSVQ